MTGNTIARVLFFWPAALLIRLAQVLLKCSKTAVGRYTVRPFFRLFCRFVLYARPYLVRRSRTNDVLSTRQLCNLIEGQRFIAAIPCVCRAGQTSCDHPHHGEHKLDVCLSFGLAAVIQIGSGLGKRLAPGEAETLCVNATNSGLAHHAIYSFGALLEVCNCCSRSCSVVKAYEAGIPEALRPSPFIAVRGPGCDGCRDRSSRVCEDICPYGKKPSTADCFGCDLCSAHCPRNAIVMESREEWERASASIEATSGRPRPTLDAGADRHKPRR